MNEINWVWLSKDDGATDYLITIIDPQSDITHEWSPMARPHSAGCQVVRALVLTVYKHFHYLVHEASWKPTCYFKHFPILGIHRNFMCDRLNKNLHSLYQNWIYFIAMHSLQIRAISIRQILNVNWFAFVEGILPTPQSHDRNTSMI